MLFSRRNMLAVGAGTLLSGVMLRDALADSRRPIFGGWLNDAAPNAARQFIAQTRRPFLRDHGRSIEGDGANKQISLIKPYERVTNRLFNPFSQEIGDCCGEAGTLGAQVLSATQIDLLKKNEEWKGEFSVEFTYAASRVEVGGGRIRRGDGSTGAWTAEAMQRVGLLLRGKYGRYDLTKYRPDLGREWGRTGVGVPDDLEKIAKDRTVKTVALVTSWREACDSLANGYPVLLCSGVGYVTRTDREGFLWRGREPWYHAMLLVGCDTISRRQGGLIANSWGTDWYEATATHKLGTPAGCFWADAQNIEAAIREGDSFALSNFVGFPRRNLDYLLY
jgi:hypothetical protein